MSQDRINDITGLSQAIDVARSKDRPFNMNVSNELLLDMYELILSQQKEIEELEDPWISVEEHGLPKIDSARKLFIVVVNGHANLSKADYFYRDKNKFGEYHGYVTHYMEPKPFMSLDER